MPASRDGSMQQCPGWSLAIYDPEQDGDGKDALRIIDLVSDVAAALP